MVSTHKPQKTTQDNNKPTDIQIIQGHYLLPQATTEGSYLYLSITSLNL